MIFRPYAALARLCAAAAVLTTLSVFPAFAQGWVGGPALGSVHVADAHSGLNVRTGPGTAYPRVGVLSRGQGGQVATCDGGGRWCALTFPNGGSGWVYMPLTRPAIIPASLGPAMDWRRLYRADVPYIHAGTGRVNLRQGAGTHRTVVAKLYPGQGGFVQGCSEDARWCLLSVPPQGVEGWAYMPLLEPISGVGTIFRP